MRTAMALAALALATGGGMEVYGQARRAGSELGATVTGQVLDAQGRPVPRAKVLIASSVYYDTNTFALTGADGRYRIEVPQVHVDTSWHVYGSVERSYNGRTYTLDLHPETNEDFNGSGPSVVRNFRWKLTGDRIGREHGTYGAKLIVGAEIGAFYDYRNVILTLTPSGPLIDGSQGRPIEVRLSADQLVEVPLGRYVVSAIHAPEGEPARPLGLRIAYKGAYLPALTMDFEPDTGRCKNCQTIEVRP